MGAVCLHEFARPTIGRPGQVIEHMAFGGPDSDGTKEPHAARGRHLTNTIELFVLDGDAACR